MTNSPHKLSCIAICFLLLSGAHFVTLGGMAKLFGENTLLGDWYGESICADKVKFPACHDEQVIYHIAATDKPGLVRITMDKVIGGKPELMDAFDFFVDKPNHQLVAEFTRNGRKGRWELTVKGNVIEGHLVTVPERSIARNITVKKKL